MTELIYCAIMFFSLGVWTGLIMAPSKEREQDIFLDGYLQGMESRKDDAI